MATYKHFCIYCDNLAPGDARVCPFCGAEDPFVARCARCRAPVEKSWLKCASCGQDLSADCPDCGKKIRTYLLKCPYCAADLAARCVNKKCGNIQPCGLGACVKCGSKTAR